MTKERISIHTTSAAKFVRHERHGRLGASRITLALASVVGRIGGYRARSRRSNSALVWFVFGAASSFPLGCELRVCVRVALRRIARFGHGALCGSTAAGRRSRACGCACTPGLRPLSVRGNLVVRNPLVLPSLGRSSCCRAPRQFHLSSPPPTPPPLAPHPPAHVVAAFLATPLARPICAQGGGRLAQRGARPGRRGPRERKCVIGTDRSCNARLRGRTRAFSPEVPPPHPRRVPARHCMGHTCGEVAPEAFRGRSFKRWGGPDARRRWGRFRIVARKWALGLQTRALRSSDEAELLAPRLGLPGRRP